MKIDVYRIKRIVKYEYSSTEQIDTSRFPECENMTLSQRLEWCVKNADRVWDGEFDDFVHGYEYNHDRENDDGLFVYASPHGEDTWSDVWDDHGGKLRKTGSGPGLVSTKYPQHQ